MILSPRLRRFSLTIHVLSSLGWFGAICAFLAIAVVGALSADPLTVRGAYTSLEALATYVLIPLALVAVASGVMQSLGTEWGLFRHYWVAIKLWLSLLATAVLLIHTGLIKTMATAAHAGAIPSPLGGTRTQLVAASAAGGVVLAVATALSIYKPRGRTRRGLRLLRGPTRPRTIYR